MKTKLTLLLFCLHLGFGANWLAASEPASGGPAKPRGKAIVPGATELSPSRSQYFSWINNRNEGSTEAQTLANLEFFKWLHDEYGMQLDIYASDAGNIDAPGSYLTVACHGVHGREGAWVALRVDSRWVGAPQRAPSYPVNPWEYPVSRTDRNYSYFIPVTQDMLGRTCEVVVLAFDPRNLDFRPDVWLTAYPVPYYEKTLTLSE